MLIKPSTQINALTFYEPERVYLAGNKDVVVQKERNKKNVPR
jgi:hypothetical protein